MNYCDENGCQNRVRYLVEPIEQPKQEYNPNLCDRMYTEEEVGLLIKFIKDCATNWDCDNDSHRYNTLCKVCEAQKVLEQFKKIEQ